MMTSYLQIYNNNGAGVAEHATLDLSLFDSYIKYIDRSPATTRAYIINLRQFIAWMRFTGITAPVRNDILSYRDYLLTEHDAIALADNSRGWVYRRDSNGNRITMACKPGTVAQYLRCLQQFFRWTAVNGLYPNIADNIHAPKVSHAHHKKDALTAKEVREIEATIDRTTETGKRTYALFLLAVNAGLRTIELSRANIRDLETKQGVSWLYIWGKGHTEADVKKAIAPQVLEAINEYLNSRGDRWNSNSPLFVATGNRSGGKRLATTTISTMLKLTMQGAGIDSPRITAHSLRHTAGTHVQELTGNLYLTQQYMRHSNPATTELYLHNDTEKQEQGIAQRLYNLYHGKTDAEDTKQKLENIIATLDPDQLEHLTGVAAAMARQH